MRRRESDETRDLPPTTAKTADYREETRATVELSQTWSASPQHSKATAELTRPGILARGTGAEVALSEGLDESPDNKATAKLIRPASAAKGAGGISSSPRVRAFLLASSCAVETGLSLLEGSRRWYRHTASVRDDIERIANEAAALELADIERDARRASRCLGADRQRRLPGAATQCSENLRRLSASIRDLARIAS
ncbi:MAG: hypothetical protein KJO07_11235 [Deltaproteobacteria bacterium]|nr:hypothetical protein [Deltaproteobacteria bacterium]